MISRVATRHHAKASLQRVNTQVACLHTAWHDLVLPKSEVGCGSGPGSGRDWDCLRCDVARLGLGSSVHVST